MDSPSIADDPLMKPAQLVDLFRTNMAAIREELGISQSELARRIGKTPGYVCDIERGRRAPNLTTLATIADGLGVTPAVLVAIQLKAQRRCDLS